MIQLNSDSIKVKENGQWSSLASLTGPKGDKGDTGATGATGAQGPQGVPGYPTIETGDAGKVLVVNSTEDAVEWGEFSGGLDIVWTGDNLNTFTNYDVEVGKSAIIYNDNLYICSRYNSYDIVFSQLLGNLSNGSYYGQMTIRYENIYSYYDEDNQEWSPFFVGTGEVDTGYYTSDISTATQGWSDGQTGKFQLVANVTHRDPDGDGGWDDISYDWELVQ